MLGLRGCFTGAPISFDRRPLRRPPSANRKGNVSALAFHGLADQLPRTVRMAIGTKNRDPMPDAHGLSGVSKRSRGRRCLRAHRGRYGEPPQRAKMVADCFSRCRTISQSFAREGLQETLRQRKATPAEIARYAGRGPASTVSRLVGFARDAPTTKSDTRRNRPLRRARSGIDRESPCLEALAAKGRWNQGCWNFGSRSPYAHRAAEGANIQPWTRAPCDSCSTDCSSRLAPVSRGAMAGSTGRSAVRAIS